MAWALLVWMGIIAYPYSPSGSGRVWNISKVGWGGKWIERFALLTLRHPPHPFSSAGAATATTSALRGRRRGGSATPCGMVAFPPLLARVFLRLDPGRRRNFPPPPPTPPSSPRITLITHAMITWSTPGGMVRNLPTYHI